VRERVSNPHHVRVTLCLDRKRSYGVMKGLGQVWSPGKHERIGAWIEPNGLRAERYGV